MNRGLHRYLIVTGGALILTGCLYRGEQPAPIKEVNPGADRSAQPVLTVPTLPAIPTQTGPVGQPEPTIPAQPKVRTYDWNSAVQPMVNKMLQADGVTPGGVLLVDSVNNHTNGSLQTSGATEVLRSALANNSTFTLVSAQQLSVAKQQLGLSPQDSLGTRSKAIGIARNAGAQYVLYTNASGNVNTPTLKMQLMLVQTGEIIWSGSGAVQQTH